jgi:alkanesulfonate monooxygenase SsuD/methylene tetrahydromethanopterin reductase-like flavin-dependent oxidoreductase (luciferase family)
MRIGISVAQCGRLARPAAITAAVRAAEQLGYSSVWVCDSLLDPAGVLSAAAAVTSSVRLGASVVVGPGDDPAGLARSLATVHHLSEGRLSVALGGPESRVDDVLDAMDACRANGARPRMMLQGVTSPSLGRVARRADGWSPSGLAIEVLGPMWEMVRGLAAARGRDPDDLHLVVRAGVALSAVPLEGLRASYEGDVDQVAGDVDLTHRIGAEEVVLRLLGDLSLDEALDGYARIAEAAELREAQRA